MGTHPIFESDFDCLTEIVRNDIIMSLNSKSICQRYGKERRFDESDRSLLSHLLTVRCNGANLTKIGDLSAPENVNNLWISEVALASASSVFIGDQLNIFISGGIIKEAGGEVRHYRNKEEL